MRAQGLGNATITGITMTGLYTDNRKENGNYYLGFKGSGSRVSLKGLGFRV